jgi:aspartyl-tRNA(Asn)/glutamyl-tRNA(Gln) amidotransferase subunit B
LVEIVTEPDLKTAVEAKEFAQKLQNIIRFLEVSDCDMEKGSMRLEANISLSPYTIHHTPNTALPNYKVEVKNINSFRFLEKAINYEIKRQSDLLSQGNTPMQETRGWSEAKNQTVPQRFKETEADYRYFPEPDIPPMEFTAEEIQKLIASIPLLPEGMARRFRDIYKLSFQYIEVLTDNKELAIFAENALKIAKKKGLPLDKLAGEIVNNKVDFNKVTVDAFIKKFKEKGKNIITSSSELEIWITKAINDTPYAVTDYKKGKTQAISAIIGNVMKLSKGKADPAVVRKLLEEKLK